MIDYGLYSTDIREPVEILKRAAAGPSFQVDRTPTKWRNTDIYKRADGVKIFITYSQSGEIVKGYLGFSPHIVSNDGLHNANPISFVKAREWIIKTFKSVGIEKEMIKLFSISNIEFNSTFLTNHDPQFLLDAAKLYKNNFFLRNFPHSVFYTGKNRKDSIKTIKFYSKALQLCNATGLTNFQAGFCAENTMRFEVKIEKPKKYGKYFEWKNAESILEDAAAEIIERIVFKELAEITFIDLTDFDKRKLTAPQRKHFDNWKRGRNFWESLAENERKKERQYFQKMQEDYFKKYPQNYPLSISVKDEIKCTFQWQKNVPKFPPKHFCKR